jgi:hypothetical protein
MPLTYELLVHQPVGVCPRAWMWCLSVHEAVAVSLQWAALCLPWYACRVGDVARLDSYGVRQQSVCLLRPVLSTAWQLPSAAACQHSGQEG